MPIELQVTNVSDNERDLGWDSSEQNSHSSQPNLKDTKTWHILEVTGYQAGVFCHMSLKLIPGHKLLSVRYQRLVRPSSRHLEGGLLFYSCQRPRFMWIEADPDTCLRLFKICVIPLTSIICRKSRFLGPHIMLY